MQTVSASSARPSRRSRSSGPRKNAILMLFIFVLAGVAAFFLLFQIFSKKIVIIPGEITYDDSLTSAEKSFLESALADFRAPENVTISASTLDTYPDTDSAADILYDTLVPVVDFYSPLSDISSADLNMSSAESSSDSSSLSANTAELISIRDLDPSKKLLSLDGNYYLDNFTSGAKFRVLHLDSKNTADIAAVIKSALPSGTSLSKSEVLSFNQTGVTALTRAMLKTLYQVGDGAYFAEYVKDFLSQSDLTHISNEISFASDCSNSADMTLCSDLRMFSAITAIGTDIVELTGNHNNDWGTSANLSTLNLYKENNLQTFGGGENETIAAAPLEISEKGTNITLIGINYSTSSKENGQGATASSPGANIYDAALTKSQIKDAKSKGNFVIVDIQYSECYSYPDEGQEMPECDYPISGQEDFFRQMIDDGADLVIGTQAHQPQTYEIYQGKPIYYGLGNLFFDQTYWPGTERSLILTHYFKDGKLLQTRITPTMYGSTYQPAIMSDAASTSYLTRLLAASSKGK